MKANHNNLIRYSFCIAILVTAISRAQAQAPGSSNSYTGFSISSGTTASEGSESLYIGPGTYLIDGTWAIAARYVIIDPTAVFAGTGVIRFYNPSAAGGAANPTIIDGNAAPGAAQKINVAIQNNNPQGVRLEERSFDSSLVAAGFQNNTSSSTLYVGKDLDLAVDGADITLGTGVTGDLRMGDSASISNYRPERMVITNNSILSHMVKENFSGAFTFPVGIADGDYTPAQVNNASRNTVRASVQHYTASASIEQTADPGPNGVPSDGMNRSWHIYADTAGIGSTLTLQHNNTTNQSGYTESNHFVTQYGPTAPNNSGDYAVGFGTSRWQSNTAGAGSTGTLLTGAVSLAGSSMRSRAYDSLATTSSSDRSYFSKSSDPFHPLPVELIRFKAQPDACAVRINWETGVQKDAEYYRLTYSKDGRVFSTLTQMPPAAGNRYSYRHRNAGEGPHYYRLQIHERDGNVVYSSIEMVLTVCGETITNIYAYPNPATDMLIVAGLDPLIPVTLRLLSMDGKLMMEQQSLSPITRLHLAQLPPASYLLQLIEEGSVKTTAKVIKQ